MFRIALFLATLVGVLQADHASQPVTTDTAPENQLDFWVGSWEVKDTTPAGKTQTGSNKIERMYDGKVIHESFKMGAFEGQSWSVYSPQQKRWNQTWVDNNGGYIAMASEMADGDLAIRTLTRPKAPLVGNRMVFSDVKPNSFMWRWEQTSDGGKTWKLSWQLQYDRAKPKKDIGLAFMKAIRLQSQLDQLG